MTTHGLVLFDIDGTLLRADGAGRRCFTLAFAEVFGVPDAFDGVPFSGRTDLDLVHSACEAHIGRSADPDELSAFFGRYVPALELDMGQGGRCEVLPHVVKLLQVLAGLERCAVGLATGNARDGAYVKLRSGGLDAFFPFGGFGSDARARLDLTRLAVERGLEVLGAAPEEAVVVVVGDSVHDVRCARAVGARAVAVTTGWTAPEALAAEEPDALVDDLARYAHPAGVRALFETLADQEVTS